VVGADSQVLLVALVGLGLAWNRRANARRRQVEDGGEAPREAEVETEGEGEQPVPPPPTEEEEDPLRWTHE
jgi:hypothetical protein